MVFDRAVDLDAARDGKCLSCPLLPLSVLLRITARPFLFDEHSSWLIAGKARLQNDRFWPASKNNCASLRGRLEWF